MRPDQKKEWREALKRDYPRIDDIFIDHALQMYETDPEWFSKMAKEGKKMARKQKSTEPKEPLQKATIELLTRDDPRLQKVFATLNSSHDIQGVLEFNGPDAGDAGGSNV